MQKNNNESVWNIHSAFLDKEDNMLETFFTNEDIKDIYDELIVYSIKKYEEEKIKIGEADSKLRKRLNRQYKNALLFLKTRNINLEELKNKTTKKLKESLDNYQQNYNMLLNLNKNEIDEVATLMKKILLPALSSQKNELDRVSLLFDFATEYFNYSYDCYHYCNQIPFASEYAFDFKNNIPIDNSYNSTLVLGQGLCGDFANFLSETSLSIGLNMEIITAKHNDNYHALNKITFSNGDVSLIDVTSYIKDKRPKSSCFLVSEAQLNEKNNYHFNEKLPKTVTITTNHLNTKKSAQILAKELEKYRPSINDLNKGKTR